MCVCLRGERLQVQSVHSSGTLLKRQSRVQVLLPLLLLLLVVVVS